MPDSGVWGCAMGILEPSPLPLLLCVSDNLLLPPSFQGNSLASPHTKKDDIPFPFIRDTPGPWGEGRLQKRGDRVWDGGYRDTGLAPREDFVRLGKTFWIFSLATPAILALDHQDRRGKHLECSDGCKEPLPSTSGQTSQRRGGPPGPVETVTLLVLPPARPQHTWALRPMSTSQPGLGLAQQPAHPPGPRLQCGLDQAVCMAYPRPWPG